jgi:quinoprotein glucose dehydrogenase
MPTGRRQRREYLVIFAGSHHFMETPMGDSMIAYALPR